MATPPSPAAPGGSEPDPSMDDILASIRRILDEDQAGKEAAPDVLVLDQSMMLEDGSKALPPVSDVTASDLPQPPAVTEPLVAEVKPAHTAPVIDEMQPFPSPIGRDAPADPGPSTLVAPEAAAAAANSVGTLMRTLAAERNTAIHRGGATVEDLVREEIRPLMKAWLDQHLPSMVERLVRAEIERVVGRYTG